MIIPCDLYKLLCKTLVFRVTVTATFTVLCVIKNTREYFISKKNKVIKKENLENKEISNKKFCNSEV